MTIEQTIEILPSRRLVVDLPFELPVGMAKMEITIVPENRQASQVEETTAFGCLRSFANPAKIHGEKGAWAQTVAENYAKD